jgi:hypothetical protein
LSDLLGAKLLDVIRFEALFALKSHARNVHRFTVDYAVLKMVKRAVHAEIVSTG